MNSIRVIATNDNDPLKLHLFYVDQYFNNILSLYNYYYVTVFHFKIEVNISSNKLTVWQ